MPHSRNPDAHIAVEENHKARIAGSALETLGDIQKYPHSVIVDEVNQLNEIKLRLEALSAKISGAPLSDEKMCHAINPDISLQGLMCEEEQAIREQRIICHTLIEQIEEQLFS